MLKDYIENKPTLTTKRLILREITQNDIPALAEWTPSASLYRYWGKGASKSDKKPSLRFQNNTKKCKSFHWGVALRDTNKVIGEMWVYNIEKDRMARLALRIAESYHGQGIGTEVLREVVRFCFENTELQRLWTDADVRNVASWHVLERCGFTREGTIRSGKMVNTWCDYHLYGLLRQDLYDK